MYTLIKATSKKEPLFLSKIEAVCGTDALRLAMQHIYFKDGWLYATDAYILVKQKIDLHGFSPESIKLLDGKLLHKDSIKTLGKCTLFSISNDGTEIQGIINKNQYITVKLINEDVNLKFPNCNAVIPKDDMQTDVGAIGINAKYLMTLQTALIGGECGLKLTFHGKERAILAHTILNDNDLNVDQIGLIMPLIIDKK